MGETYVQWYRYWKLHIENHLFYRGFSTRNIRYTYMYKNFMYVPTISGVSEVVRQVQHFPDQYFRAQSKTLAVCTG